MQPPDGAAGLREACFIGFGFAEYGRQADGFFGILADCRCGGRFFRRFRRGLGSRAADNRIRGRDMVSFLFFGCGEQFFQTAFVVEGRPRLYPFGA